MLKSHPIRLAVNLCLIGALLLSHGGFGPAIASACQASAITSAKCAGCGNCAVESEGARCGCCSKKGNEAPAKQQHAQNHGCCHESPATDESNNDSDSDGVGACLCGQGSQPAVPASQSRVDVEQVVKLATNLVSTLGSDDYAAARSVVNWSESLILLPRDSQRRLCIWLI